MGDSCHGVQRRDLVGDRRKTALRVLNDLEVMG
jgi:hypothetical protein